MKYYKNLNVRFKPKEFWILDSLQKEADRNQVTLSVQVRTVLENWVKKNKKEKSK